MKMLHPYFALRSELHQLWGKPLIQSNIIWYLVLNYKNDYWNSIHLKISMTHLYFPFWRMVIATFYFFRSLSFPSKHILMFPYPVEIFMINCLLVMKLAKYSRQLLLPSEFYKWFILRWYFCHWKPGYGDIDVYRASVIMYLVETDTYI